MCVCVRACVCDNICLKASTRTHSQQKDRQGGPVSPMSHDRGPDLKLRPGHSTHFLLQVQSASRWRQSRPGTGVEAQNTGMHWTATEGALDLNHSWSLRGLLWFNKIPPSVCR